MKTVVADPWSESNEEAFELERVEHRKTHGKITFDCLQARVMGNRVRCAAGHKLHPGSRDGSMYLIAVLRGRTSNACIFCTDYKS